MTRSVLVVALALSGLAPGVPLSTAQGATQPPAQSPPAAAQPAPAPRPQGALGGGVGRPVTVTVAVTDGGGLGVANTHVAISGPVTREGATVADGSFRALAVKPGTYRFRFEREGFITLERDVTVRSGQPTDVDVMLTRAPAPSAPAAPPPDAAPPQLSAGTAPPGQARNVVLVDFIERNLVSGHDPKREDQLGCTASAKTTLLQLRENTAETSNPDADEVLYVVAGEGSLRLGNRDVGLSSSTVAIVPRGTVRAITRKGRNPLIVLSIVSGPACTK